MEERSEEKEQWRTKIKARTEGCPRNHSRKGCKEDACTQGSASRADGQMDKADKRVVFENKMIFREAASAKWWGQQPGCGGL